MAQPTAVPGPLARDADGGVTLRVRAQPRASREGLGGERNGALVVRVTAPPVEGAANEAIARLLARTLDVAPSSVRVQRGAAGRVKLVHIEGLTARELLERLDGAR